MAGQLPDFDGLANSMRTSANGILEAVTELQKISNDPVIAVARMEELLNGLGREMRTIGDEIRNLRLDMNRRERNKWARNINSKIISSRTLLEPLLGPDGQAIANFPGTYREINDMDSAALDRLLNSLGLPLGGSIEDQRLRVRRHVGY